MITRTSWPAELEAIHVDFYYGAPTASAFSVGAYCLSYNTSLIEVKYFSKVMLMEWYFYIVSVFEVQIAARP